LRILLITGRTAEPIVRSAVNDIPPQHEVDVSVMPIEVAALASPKAIINYVKRNVDISRYDLIMVSGAIRGSLRDAERKLGIRIVKGPKHAAYIPDVIAKCDLKELSPEIPADELLRKTVIEVSSRIISQTERELTGKPHIKVGEALVPIRPPPIRVISEIPDADQIKVERLLREVKRRIDEGADIISLGFGAYPANPLKVTEAVKAVKDNFEIPVALDSMNPKEIIAGLKAGVDLVMSLEAGNIRRVSTYVGNTPAVVVPYDSSRRIQPKDINDKLNLLEENIETALRLGIETVIADPILGHIDVRGGNGLLHSLYAYTILKDKMPNVPKLMGICNVVELIDADSPGINALLTMLAGEAKVSLVLVVEKSVKTYMSTYEVAVASRMVTISYRRSIPPKDLGVDLLILKEKKRISVPLRPSGATVVKAKLEEEGYEIDRMGVFTIRVNYDEGLIEALYVGRKGRILIRGETSTSICNEILRRGLVSSISHAMYLGRELSKAEEALKTGKNYIQDEGLFVKRNRIDLSFGGRP